MDQHGDSSLQAFNKKYKLWELFGSFWMFIFPLKLSAKLMEPNWNSLHTAAEWRAKFCDRRFIDQLKQHRKSATGHLHKSSERNDRIWMILFTLFMLWINWKANEGKAGKSASIFFPCGSLPGVDFTVELLRNGKVGVWSFEIFYLWIKLFERVMMAGWRWQGDDAGWCSLIR